MGKGLRHNLAQAVCSQSQCQSCPISSPLERKYLKLLKVHGKKPLQDHFQRMQCPKDELFSPDCTQVILDDALVLKLGPRGYIIIIYALQMIEKKSV